MKVKKVIAPQGALYLSDIEEYASELPDNCLFHKGKTGCGGTTIALKNNIDTIICVPFRSLIFNKLNMTGGYPYEILGVCQQENGSQVTDERILEYINSQHVRKIMTTYDSLLRVVELMEGASGVSLGGFRLIIDEYQILFSSYGYRYTAARKVLDSLCKFSHVTFMTATPIQKDFLFHELRRFDIEEVHWLEEPSTQVKIKVTNSVIQMTKQEINATSQPDVNFHFFINSVKLIAQIIKHANLDAQVTRIVCADNRPSKGKTNQEKLPDGFRVGRITDPVLKYNFYTCCAFEGCDIFDECGKIIIVSDSNNIHTLLDIKTSIPQIIGRIRNSQYRNTITHICSMLRPKEMMEMGYRLENLNFMFSEAKDFVADVNNMNKTKHRKAVSDFYDFYRNNSFSAQGYDYLFWNAKRNILQCDRAMFDLEKYNISIVRSLYFLPTKLRLAYSKEGFTCELERSYLEPVESESGCTRTSFRESFKKYVSLKEEESSMCYFFTEREQDVIARWFPLIPQAYVVLGKERVETLNYNQSKIKQELLTRECSSNKERVRRLFLESYSYGETITGANVKTKLQEIYGRLSLRIAATAKQIESYFSVRHKTIRVQGVSTRVYILVETLFPES